MTEIKDIYNYITSIAPLSEQEDWDNSGMLVGDIDAEVKTVVLSLDASKAVVDFTIGMGAELLITHHPVIFGGADRVLKGEAVYELVSSGVSAVCIHTPFDKAVGGINSRLAKLLELKNVRIDDNAFIAVGELEYPMSIDDFALFVSDSLNCSGLRYTDSDTMIKSVAVCGGSGDEFFGHAMTVADCYVTGEAKYHTMLEASENNYPYISAGHYETEYAAFCSLKDDLSARFKDVEFIIAPEKNPVSAVQ